MLLLITDSHSFQMEGGLNYDFKETNFFFSVDFFPWSTEKVDRADEEYWKGYALNISYEKKNVFLCPMYGKAEFYPKIITTIFFGPKFGIIDYRKVGISLKGSTYLWRSFPFSLIIDPKYDFKEKRFIWDFKCSIGIGEFFL